MQISSLFFPFSVIAANAMPGICAQCQTCAWQNVVSEHNLTQISKAFFFAKFFFGIFLGFLSCGKMKVTV